MYLLCWAWLIIKVFPFASLGNEKVFLSLPWIILEATGLAGRMYLEEPKLGLAPGNGSGS